MAILLKGAPVADSITEQLKTRSLSLKSHGISPTLAIVRVGEQDSDLSYERGAIKRCEKTGIDVRSFVLPGDSTTDTLISTIEQINSDPGIHGCLMFRPLPKHIDEAKVCEVLDPRKDVDSMTSTSLMHVFTGKGDGFAPCTAQSCIEILDHYGFDPAGRNIAVLGRSLVIGKPVSMLLQSRNATVTMCHSKTTDLPNICKRSDILVVAVGHLNTVDASFTHADQIILDVGINVDDSGKLCGDVDFVSAEPCCKAITPVPGGVGSVTTAVLCKHLIEAAEKTFQ